VTRDHQALAADVECSHRSYALENNEISVTEHNFTRNNPEFMTVNNFLPWTAK
jgi:hypothetical protein